MDYKYKASIVIVTYNCQFEKLLKTLESILKQDIKEKQIVISDDGSSDNHFNQLREYFDKMDFLNYILVGADENTGTVKNILRGLEKCEGEWIKLISPGDSFINSSDLREWIDFATSQSKEWSFCGTVYYKLDNNQIVYIKSWRHPSILNCYITNNEEKCRLNYVSLGDGVNGACVICKKEIMLLYLKKISSMVTFAEDYMHIMMMWDGIVPCYFAKDCILYECGSGISTNGSRRWQKILDRERHILYSYIINKLEVNDKVQKRIRQRLKIINHGSIRLYIYIIWRSILLLFEKNRHTSTRIIREEKSML